MTTSTTTPKCSSCGRPMIWIATFSFRPDEPTVRRLKAIGVEIVGEVHEWGCAPCQQGAYVWPAR